MTFNRVELERRNEPVRAFVDFADVPASGDGPLADITIGIKANLAVRGLPWTGGMALFRNRIAEQDAAAVARLRAEGATIVGTLNMHEAALGATTDNPWFGRTINPHRANHTAGGSSGGSGAAVAAGLVDAALGTDTLGSIRIPASYCGVYGLKPTHGAVPTDGLIFLDRNYDTVGPLARDLQTLQRVQRVLAPDSGDESSFQHVAVLTNLGGAEVQAPVRAAYDRALGAIELPGKFWRLPADTTAIRLAALAEVGRSLIVELGPARTEQRELISPELHAILHALEAVPTRPELLAETRLAVSEAIGTSGVLLLPTTPHVAFPHGGRAPHNQADFTSLANIAGLPALSIPAGVDVEGLPIGLQLIGPKNGEHRLIALARQLEPVLGGAISSKQEAEA